MMSGVRRNVVALYWDLHTSTLLVLKLNLEMLARTNGSSFLNLVPWTPMSVGKREPTEDRRSKLVGLHGFKNRFHRSVVLTLV
jgi:hypothetical protein